MYVLPGITAAQRQQLIEAGVTVFDWTNGIMVDGTDNRDNALRVLNATATEVETPLEEIVELVLHYNRPGVTAAAQTARARTQDVTQVMAEEYEAIHGAPPDAQWWEDHGRAPPGERNRAGPRIDARRVENFDRTNPNDPRAISRRNYIEACRARLEEVRQQARNSAQPVFEELKKAERQFVRLSRQNAILNNTLSDDELVARFNEDIEQIRGTEKVVDVRVIPNSVLIYTDTLYAAAPDSGVRHEIGKFLIWVRLDEVNAGVYWFNSSRRVDGARNDMNAPYVYNDGRASSDDTKQAFLDMIARCELGPIADLAIQYIETVNPENPLTAYLENWPRA
jgi:hypothetical protein